VAESRIGGVPAAGIQPGAPTGGSAGNHANGHAATAAGVPDSLGVRVEGGDTHSGATGRNTLRPEAGRQASAARSAIHK